MEEPMNNLNDLTDQESIRKEILDLENKLEYETDESMREAIRNFLHELRKLLQA